MKLDRLVWIAVKHGEMTNEDAARVLGKSLRETEAFLEQMEQDELRNGKLFTSLPMTQLDVGTWSREMFGDQVSKATGAALGSLAPLLGIGEELGELQHVVLKRHQGIRGYELDERYWEDRDDAIADILIYLCDFACREGVDLQSVLAQVWYRVRSRNWKKNPETAAAT